MLKARAWEGYPLQLIYQFSDIPATRRRRHFHVWRQYGKPLHRWLRRLAMNNPTVGYLPECHECSVDIGLVNIMYRSIKHGRWSLCIARTTCQCYSLELDSCQIMVGRRTKNRQTNTSFKHNWHDHDLCCKFEQTFEGFNPSRAVYLSLLACSTSTCH